MVFSTAASAHEKSYKVTDKGIELLSGNFEDNGHINVRLSDGKTVNVHFESKCKGASKNEKPECFSASGPSKADFAQYIGKTFIPWTTFGVELSKDQCVCWVQVGGRDYHFGEDGESKCGEKPNTPEPTPTPTPNPTPTPTPSTPEPTPTPTTEEPPSTPEPTPTTSAPEPTPGTESPVTEEPTTEPSQTPGVTPTDPPSDTLSGETQTPDPEPEDLISIEDDESPDSGTLSDVETPDPDSVTVSGEDTLAETGNSAATTGVLIGAVLLVAGGAAIRRYSGSARRS